jgi:flagellar motor protein MotB
MALDVPVPEKFGRYVFRQGSGWICASEYCDHIHCVRMAGTPEDRKMKIVAKLLVLGVLATTAACAGPKTVTVVDDTALKACQSERDAIAQDRERFAQENKRLTALAEQRAELLESLRRDLDDLIGKGVLSIEIRRGRLVLVLPNKVLFPSGESKLTPEGAATVKAIGARLKEVASRRFLVAGHTDNVAPKSTAAFKTNWELAHLRSMSVLRVLLEAGMKPTALGATSYGQHDPVSKNDTDDGKAKNRRTEIILVPDLERVLTAGR